MKADHPPTQSARRRPRLAPRIAATELGIVALGALVYVVVREVTEGSPERAIANAQHLLHMERSLGIDVERQVQEFVLGHDWLRTAANWVYIWGHWPVIISVATFLFLRDRARYLWLRNSMFASGMLGFAFFALVPMAPPRLASFSYVDTVTTWSTSYRVLQPPDLANLYAAMPSLHFGWDLLVGIALFTSVRSWILRVFACTMPTLMAFAVIATGNHWVLDVAVGLVVVGIGAMAADALAASNVRRLAHRRRSREAVRESI